MKESQQKMMKHSEIKIRLLKLYLERYLNILSKSPYVSDIHLYDLFCGEGIYQDGTRGSPIIILETINEIKSSKLAGVVNSKFNCNFNDIDKSKIQNLERLVTEGTLFRQDCGKLTFTSTDYRVLLPKIEREINAFDKQKAFIFIDP